MQSTSEDRTVYRIVRGRFGLQNVDDRAQDLTDLIC